MPFSAFVVGGGTGATFTSIGAIELFINGVIELDATVSVLRSLRPNEVTSNLENLAPSVQITKFTNGQDANTVGSGPYLAVGATATFSYTVVSTGGTTLQNVVVTDDNGTAGNPADDFSPTFVGGDTNSDSILDVGETWTYTATRTVTAGAHTNIGRVTAEDSGATQVSDTDPSNHFGVNASINVVKSTNGADANTATGPVLPVGSTATFTYVVTNPGNVALGSVSVVDNNGTLAVRRTTSTPHSRAAIRTATAGWIQRKPGRTRPHAPSPPASTRTSATATGTPLDASGMAITGIAAVTDTDPSNHFGATAGINVVKSTNGQDANTRHRDRCCSSARPRPSRTSSPTRATCRWRPSSCTDDNSTTGTTGDDFTATFQSGDTDSNGRLDTTETWTFQATRLVTARPTHEHRHGNRQPGR